MMKISPRMEINLDKLTHNATVLKKLYGKKGIEVTAVVKGAVGSLPVAEAIIFSGIQSLADSKIANIKKMKEAKIPATFILLRSPALSEVKDTVKYADISLNTELEVIRALSHEAERQGKIHSIILMVEMGDLREGIMQKDLPAFINEVLELKGVQIVGIGTNFACFGGVIPTERKMMEFSDLVRSLSNQFNLKLRYVSGGNSANYQWMMSATDVGIVNHVRLGESILLGTDPVSQKLIPGLYGDAFRFVGEVIEVKRKPSVPYGRRAANAFGEKTVFKDRGIMQRAILGVGRQDVLVSGLSPTQPVEILGSSSDHIILNAKNTDIKVGDEVVFIPNYGAMLSAMTSPYVHKQYIYTKKKKKLLLQKTIA